MAKRARQISQYRGPLTPEDAADGINAASRNAGRLAQDSQLLLEHKRFPSALALAALSIEESGKAGILRSIGMSTSEIELNRNWKEYRSHTSKNSLWVVADYIMKGARTLDDFAAIFDPAKDHPQVLDELKQLSFYTECVRAGRWLEPQEVVDEKLAAAIVGVATILSGAKSVSAAELEIYFRHVGPARNGTAARVKRAFIEAYAEMQERGIALPGSNKAEDFVNGLIGRSMTQTNDDE